MDVSHPCTNCNADANAFTGARLVTRHHLFRGVCRFGGRGSWVGGGGGGNCAGPRCLRLLCKLKLSISSALYWFLMSLQKGI
jgi:hypothetical protein